MNQDMSILSLVLNASFVVQIVMVLLIGVSGIAAISFVAGLVVARRPTT